VKCLITKIFYSDSSEQIAFDKNEVQVSRLGMARKTGHDVTRHVQQSTNHVMITLLLRLSYRLATFEVNT
jgi:hypothetical protein